MSERAQKIAEKIGAIVWEEYDFDLALVDEIGMIIARHLDPIEIGVLEVAAAQNTRAGSLPKGRQRLWFAFQAKALLDALEPELDG